MSPLMLAQKFPLATLTLSPFPSERTIATAAVERVARGQQPHRRRASYVACAVTTAMYGDSGWDSIRRELGVRP